MEFKTKPNNEGYEQIMIAIITGASSGIGYEFARQIDKKNYEEIWLIARRTERLHDLSKKLQTRARIFALDLCEEKSFEALKKELEISNKKIGLLINSAGMGENDYFKNTSFDNDMKTLDLNIKALTAMTKISLNFFQKDGIILNIASSAAFIPQAKFALYAASKSYVLSFSRAVRREFKDIRPALGHLRPQHDHAAGQPRRPDRHGEYAGQLRRPLAGRHGLLDPPARQLGRGGPARRG